MVPGVYGIICIVPRSFFHITHPQVLSPHRTSFPEDLIARIVHRTCHEICPNSPGSLKQKSQRPLRGFPCPRPWAPVRPNDTVNHHSWLRTQMLAHWYAACYDVRTYIDAGAARSSDLSMIPGWKIRGISKNTKNFMTF